LNYQEYIPSEVLRDYVKCYYLYASDLTRAIEDKAFATGCVEIMFNLDGTQWETQKNDGFTKTAKVEVWGQILRPLPLRLTGKSTMMGIRFHPYGAALFLNEDLSLLNDLVIDLSSVMGKSVEDLYNRLRDTSGTLDRIALIESFLLKRLGQIQHKKDKTTLVRRVMHELTRDDFFDNIENVAARHGITSRYLQKVFLQHTGLTPKLYSKINRFQKSLVLIGKGNLPLTSIAYQSGYFDQSHFIREFRTFTGTTPSGFDAELSSAILASPNKE
jgi:AraC-like DNA-binding protein